MGCPPTTWLNSRKMLIPTPHGSAAPATQNHADRGRGGAEFPPQEGTEEWVGAGEMEGTGLMEEPGFLTC